MVFNLRCEIKYKSVYPSLMVKSNIKAIYSSPSHIIQQQSINLPSTSNSNSTPTIKDDYSTMQNMEQQGAPCPSSSIARANPADERAQRILVRSFKFFTSDIHFLLFQIEMFPDLDLTDFIQRFGQQMSIEGKRRDWAEKTKHKFFYFRTGGDHHPTTGRNTKEAQTQPATGR